MGKRKINDTMRAAVTATVLACAQASRDRGETGLLSKLPLVGAVMFGSEFRAGAPKKNPQRVYWATPSGQSWTLARDWKAFKGHLDAWADKYGVADKRRELARKRRSEALAVAGVVAAGVVSIVGTPAAGAAVLAATQGLAAATADGKVELGELAGIVRDTYVAAKDDSEAAERDQVEHAATQLEDASIAPAVGAYAARADVVGWRQAAAEMEAAWGFEAAMLVLRATKLVRSDLFGG